MYSPDGLELVNFSKVPNRLEILDPNRLVILDPTSEDLAVVSADAEKGGWAHLSGSAWTESR